MEVTSLDVIIRLTRKDVAIARLLIYYRSRFGIIATVIGSVLGLFQIIAIVQNRPAGYSVPTIMLPLILVLLLPLGVAFGGLYGPAVSKWLTEVRYSFGDEGFRVSIPSVTAQFSWSEVTSFLQTNKYIALSIPSALQVLPISGLENEVVSQLRELVRDRASQLSKKRPV
jgi:type III secretory pathway component EscS